MKGKFSNAFEEDFPTLHLVLANNYAKITSVIQVREAIRFVFPSGLLRNIRKSLLINDLPALGLNQGLGDLWGEGRKRAMPYFHYPVQRTQSRACNMMTAMYLLSLLCLSVLHLSDSKKTV